MMLPAILTFWLGSLVGNNLLVVSLGNRYTTAQLQKGQKVFFDVRVFNPFAKSHLNQKLDTAFKSNENEKKRMYNQRVIEIEHGSFSPLVFTPYGGTGREAENHDRASAEARRAKEHDL